MDTSVRTPMQVFGLPQHLVVPLFQRAYVWEQSEQWEPFWQDVSRMAELRLAEPHANPSHFLGAVVMQANEQPVATLSTSNVIDGQQRLTTLLLLVNATAAVLEEEGLTALAGQLEGLTHNLPNYVPAGETRLKLRHTNSDQEAFDEVMDAAVPIEYERLRHAGSLIVRAHQFFFEAASSWLLVGEEGIDVRRAEVLAQVLQTGLQLVVISLQADENSFEIFETLNARGTPLTAADLVRNFTFQQLEIEEEDVGSAYAEDWPFETKFWAEAVSVGRHRMSRSSVFLNQWLASRLGRELSPAVTFSRFKHFVEHQAKQPMRLLLREIKVQAQQYEAWTRAAENPDMQLDPVQMSVYRMHTSGVELLKPILLWLHEPGKEVAEPVVHEVVRAVESWVIRRQLLRLSISDLGRVVADIIDLHRDVPVEELAPRVRAHLSRLDRASTYWPGDEEVRSVLRSEPMFRRLQRGRLRMVLEAIEDRKRVRTNQPQVPRRRFPIEHVLPQAWERHWPVDGPEAELERSAHVHVLGNLTLLTRRLNSKVSNGPWGGTNGKRERLKEHDTFLLNRVFLGEDAEVWDETAIRRRTEALIDDILAVWPVPAGHTGVVADAQATNASVTMQFLVAAGHVSAGTVLRAPSSYQSDITATVADDGWFIVDGQRFHSPSGAARQAAGKVVNGWWFWRLPDGRRLKDIRAQYRSKVEHPAPRVDWSPLHDLLERLPEGRWTTDVAVAEYAGTSGQALRTHAAGCGQCANTHRILLPGGKITTSRTAIDPSESRHAVNRLKDEGVAIVDGAADPAKKLSAADLGRL